MTDFGRWLIDAMAAKEWTQMDLADASGLGQSTISGYVSGARKPRRPKDVIHLATLLYPGEEKAPSGDRLFIDTALLASEFAPHYQTYRVVREDSAEYIYQPILKDIEEAAESGNLDAEAVRRIRLQIQIETEEAARRRSAAEEPEEE